MNCQTGSFPFYWTPQVPLVIFRRILVFFVRSTGVVLAWIPVSGDDVILRDFRCRTNSLIFGLI